MSSDWIETQWGKIATLEYGKGLRDYKSGKGEHPVYGTNGQVGYCDSQLCSHAGVIVGRKGAYRGIHYCPKPFFVIDTAYWLKPKQIIDLQWAYYELLSQDINSLDSGSAIPSTSRDSFYSLDVRLPPLSEQKAIAQILGTLDDKIELNRKTNETLEAMAKALFKSWFVDFDPVRAKAEGSPTGLPDEISDLFPDSFEDSELGQIPRGWGVSGLEQFLVLQRGFDLPATQRIHGKYPVIAASGPSGCHDKSMATAPGVVTGRSGVLGKVFYVQSDFFPLNTTLWAKEFRRATPIYAYCLLGSIDFSSFNAGSAVPTLNRNHLGGLRFSTPPQELIRAYSEAAVSLMERVQQISKHIACLVETRDTLLPKLISGELRIPEAELMLEEAGV